MASERASWDQAFARRAIRILGSKYRMVATIQIPNTIQCVHPSGIPHDKATPTDTPKSVFEIPRIWNLFIKLLHFRTHERELRRVVSESY